VAIWYHGTTQENADAILASGFFKQGTFFADNMGSALHYGGDCIFEVFFPVAPSTYWEWVCPKPLLVKGFVRLLFRAIPEVLYRGLDAEMADRQQDLLLRNPGKQVCVACCGRGQVEDPPPFVRWRDNRPCTTCNTCRGHGYVPSDMDAAIMPS